MALPQPLHIFQKDLRHLWPETLVTLVLFALFAAGNSYDASDSQLAGLIPFGLFLLKVLMLISWLVVISRLIQDEPLVGDRQFWTSRPYHWAWLLTAKILYLIVFLYVPFLLMQVFLLLHAGLYPMTAIGPLLHNLLLLTVLVVVPIAVLSAVTSSFVWVLLSVLGAAVYVAIIVAVLAFHALSDLTPPAFEPVLYAIVILLPFAVLVYQYATRRTQTARLLLLATPLLIMGLILVAPFGALVRQGYPVASGKDVPKLEDLPDGFRPKQPQPGQLIDRGGKVHLVLPFLVSGIDPDTNYVVRGTSLTIDAPGLHWQSAYQAGGLASVAQPIELNAGSRYGVARVEVPDAIFDQLRSVPADVHLSMAAEQFKASKPDTWQAHAPKFDVPGHGTCSFDKDDPADRPVACKYPFNTPELNLVTAPVSAGSCAADAPKQPSRARVDGKLAWLDFNPVVQVDMVFAAGRQQDTRQAPQNYRLCPGTPLAFITARKVGKVRLEVDEKKMLLNNFALRVAPDNGPGGPQGGSAR